MEAAVPGALVNALPPAALGALVVIACRRIAWMPEAQGRFFRAHGGLLVAYAVLVAAVETSLWIMLDSIRTGSLTFAGFSASITAWQLLMAAIAYCAIAGVTYTLDAQARLARARALQAEAELAALRGQLNPHFLFNTLHTVMALVREDRARAEKALEQFGDLLRYSLRVQRETRDQGTLAEEWKFVQDYLALEQLRLGDRLRVETHVQPEAMDCIVPVFCLQPLVENAVRHGIAPRAGGGRVAISARVENGCVELAVEDDGPGSDGVTPGAAPGGGLRLVRQRIDALYGDAGEVAVEPRAPGRGFAVRARIPVERP
jgi:LytS/YehU family sensor histidine kinase